MADCINYVYEDGTEFNGTFNQLEKKEIISIRPYKENCLTYIEATIKQ